MRIQSTSTTFARLAILASIVVLGTIPAAFADETRAPVVSKKKLSPGETQTLNPQPIPPGKPATAAKASKGGSDKSIIFVGGKRAKPIPSVANPR